MTTYHLTTENPEETLYKIRDNLSILNFAIYGMINYYDLNDQKIEGLEVLVRGMQGDVEELIRGLSIIVT